MRTIRHLCVRGGFFFRNTWFGVFCGGEGRGIPTIEVVELGWAGLGCGIEFEAMRNGE